LLLGRLLGRCLLLEWLLGRCLLLEWLLGRCLLGGWLDLLWLGLGLLLELCPCGVPRSYRGLLAAGLLAGWLAVRRL
jgi:hypothetical protein